MICDSRGRNFYFETSVSDFFVVIFVKQIRFGVDKLESELFKFVIL